jgi:hypothetical protein
MFQRECRFGWRWNRYFGEFHQYVMDEEDRLAFNGPLYKTKEWIRLGKNTAVS